jgi:Ca2+-binding RTX toxin-like protein
MERKAVLMATIAVALLLVSAGVALADTITCDPDCFGTEFNDKMFGDANDNGMFGFEGNDKAYGRDGEDYLIGFEGRDLLVGGSGEDILDVATSENSSGPLDTVRAGDDADIILAENNKRDRIDCGGGDDVALIDEGIDRVRNC